MLCSLNVYVPCAGEVKGTEFQKFELEVIQGLKLEQKVTWDIRKRVMTISWLFLIWVSSSIPVMKQMLFPSCHMLLPSHLFSAPRVYCICEESGGKKIYTKFLAVP